MTLQISTKFFFRYRWSKFAELSRGETVKSWTFPVRVLSQGKLPVCCERHGESRHNGLHTKNRPSRNTSKI